ncbi:TraR/DksA C4-type zinc finger protein [Patescibacteria group bacterium]|nr:TraR/DksA C4-type zinc finger protein [Patescibacteria group bacterium]
MTNWQHREISRERARALLSQREGELEIERRRDVAAARRGLRGSCDPPNKGDTVDQCENGGKFSVATEKKIKNNLRCVEKLKDAAKKIANGSYGICEKCKEEIPLGRLQARPETELCCFCKERQKKRGEMPAKNFNPLYARM